MEQAFNVLIEKGGLVGAMCIFLIYVCMRLYNDKEVIQEKRITNAEQTTEKVTTALKENTTQFIALTDLIKTTLSTMAK